jgi:hypothetical protein
VDNPMLEAAIRYANYGWPVFPVQPRSKQPYGKTNGCLDATTDLVDIHVWWDEFPESNVAIATGQPGPDVLDIDVKAGAPGIQTLKKIKLNRLNDGAFGVARTPSGGYHLYYKGTDQPNGSLRLHGVDFRGKGGYVVAAPSVLEEGVYMWLGRRPYTNKPLNWTAIRNFFAPPPSEVRERVKGSGDFSGLIAYMASMPPGGRNNSLYSITRQFMDELASEGDFDDLAAAAALAGLSEQEIRTTMQSARRR